MTAPADPLTTQWTDVRKVLDAPAPVSPLPWAQPEQPPAERKEATEAVIPKSEPQRRAAGPPKLGKAESVMVAFVILAAIAVGALGLASSFDTLEKAARAWHFSEPWMLPLGIDIAIPVFSLAHLLLIRLDMPLGWVRAVPWGLTGATVYLNWDAQPPGTPLSGRIGHAALPLVWVVLSEIAAHTYKVRIGATTGRRMEVIRRSRWIFAPVSTARIRRRMSLWEITSYRDALARERDRQLARAALRETYGLGWRWSAPLRDRVLLRLGELAPADVKVSPSLDETTGETAHGAGHQVTVERVETSSRPGGETAALETTEQVSRPALETGNPSGSETATETTRETKPRRSRETKPKAKRTRPTVKPRKVSPIADIDHEVSTLVGLMRERGGADQVVLNDAIETTGRPKATAARRLETARQRYLRETPTKTA